MKEISSETICNFFYVFFVIYAIFFALAVVSTLVIFGNMKKLGPAAIGLGVQGVLMSGISGTLFLFYYLICERALLKKKI